MNEQLVGVDCLAAPEIAGKVLDVGVKKARMAFRPMFTLALLAGAYIGLGAMFATVAGAGGAALPFGVYRVLFGFVFCLGLILVVVAGAELFTGNTLITMAWASGRLGVGLLLRNWTIVWIGNLIGSLIMALLVFLAGNYLMGNGQVGQLALSVANTKAGIGFGQAVASGILCNTLVCLAVWMAYGARASVDKVVVIVFPITAFVASGFEHCVANMYFIPVGIFINTFDPGFAVSHNADVANLTLQGFAANLIPVTIGNIIGGVVIVGLAYWYAYLRPAQQA